MTLAAGQILNQRYRIDYLLGRGGMSTVYKAWDLNLDVYCALKENLAAEADSTSQFMREAHMLAQLTHANLPRVRDYFTLPNVGQFLVMDFIEGQDLQEMIDSRGALPEVDALGYILQVCDALSYLHSRPESIIHRDIKPANIRITGEGAAYLVDFGIAKRHDPHKHTTQGARAVTPGYSPPEQYGHGQTDHRSDIYALAATLLALLTGNTPLESVQRYGTDRLTIPSTISRSVQQALMCALQLAPEERFSTVAYFQKGLTVLSPLPQTKRIVYSKPSIWRWAIPGLLVLGLGTGLWMMRPWVGRSVAAPTPAVVSFAPTDQAMELMPTPIVVQVESLKTQEATLTATEVPTEMPLPTETAAFTLTPTPTPQALPLSEPVLLRPSNVSASAFAGSSNDACGNVTTYEAINAIDGDPQTAWRVAGNGVNEFIQLEFSPAIEVDEIKLIPGYAKVDPCDGADRFPQMRRVKLVRFDFSDGTKLEGLFFDNRDMQSISVPEVTTTFIRVTILETLTYTTFDFTPISEVEVWGR